MELSNRDRARERLEQYLIASRDYNFYQYRIDTVREEMTHCTAAIGSKSSGNTGKYETEEVHCWYCIGIESHGIATVKTVTDEYGHELGAYDTPYNYCPNCGRKIKED